MYERNCLNCKGILTIKDYTKEDPVCKHCGIPYVLENWVPIYASRLFSLVVLFICILVFPDYGEYSFNVAFVISLVALVWFEIRIIPYALSDIVIDYKKVKELGIEDKLSRYLR